MSSSSTQVLDHQQVLHKISRIAWQIYEEHQEAETVLLAGIAKRGAVLAELLAKELKAISDLEVELATIHLNKDAPLSEPLQISGVRGPFDGKNVVVIDDVLNSGATLIYGVRFFLDFPVQSIHTVVLVDRNHKRFPVKADFKGLSLSTALQEHVQVNIETAPFAVTVS